MILVLPWLQVHNQQISWTEKQITQWSDCCLQQCVLTIPLKSLHFATVQLEPSSIPNLPPEYDNLAEVFSKTKASQLLHHHSNDCAIDLLPSRTPPEGRVFPLSQTESEAMKTCIEEELAKSFIRPSISPATAVFYLRKHLGWGTSSLHRLSRPERNNCQFLLPVASGSP